MTIKIYNIAQRNDSPVPDYSVNGEVLTFNETGYDLSSVESSIEIDEPLFAGPIWRDESGDLIVNIIIPVAGGEEFPVYEDAPIQPIQKTTSEKILSAPEDLFGGPTLGEIFNGN